MRTSRSNGTVTYRYVYSGDKLVQMTITDHTTSPETVQLLEFTYDAAGQPLTMTYDGDLYYYLLNIQGDVMGLYDESGNLKVSYVYEGYGAGYYVNNTSDMEATLAVVNPLAYRGYVLDMGTNLYYLQSRYYDPTLGRFLNADAFASTDQGLVSNNMFTYCLNNPVKYYDDSGYSAAMPPMIENGLNLPASGGWPVVIDGTLYYYAIDVQNGELFEYWFDAEGNLIWGRHHSTHTKSHKHEYPHDHKGGKDKDGNNTLVDGPQPVNNKFKGPKEYAAPTKESSKVANYIAAGAVAGTVIYQVAKWVVAALLSTYTGGASLGVAAAMP